jgi:hypothetical protein
VLDDDGRGFDELAAECQREEKNGFSGSTTFAENPGQISMLADAPTIPSITICTGIPSMITVKSPLLAPDGNSSGLRGGFAHSERRQQPRGSDWNKDFDLKKGPKVWQAARGSGRRTSEEAV